ncbi:MAG: O-antigen ligase family protein [Tannerella sp.]|jgi:hypothetical protein|nr:O-antigen ligase family protein [Tannerella sp.]
MDVAKNIYVSVKKNILLFTGLLAILFLAITKDTIGLFGSCLIALLPFVLLSLYYSIQNPYGLYFTIFILNYFVMGLNRYIPAIPGGVIIDGSLLLLLIILLFQSTYKRIPWKYSFNGWTLVSVIWMIYCYCCLWNPESVSKGAWFTAIRGMAFYMLIVAILVPLIIMNYKQMKAFVIVWGVLIFFAAAKAYIQKNVGFDDAEWRWLMERGGTTHLLATGTRYFSFFTDASNFGTGLAFAAVVFLITSFFEKGWVRIYYWFVVVAAIYGMVVSGTRTAMAIPFFSFVLYAAICRNWKVSTFIISLMVVIFCFFKFTYIGQGHPDIRRMRSAFDSNNASKNVRVENQKLIRTYMADKPFGVGLGLGGVRAQEYTPDSYIAKIPTDSWFVSVWVETGIVGLTLYLLLMFSCIGYGVYLIVFKLKNRQLKAYVSSFTVGIFAMLLASSSNEIFAQFSNSIIIYTFFAFIFISPRLDKELIDEQTN